MYKIIIRSLVVSAALIFGATVTPAYAKTAAPNCLKLPTNSAKKNKLAEALCPYLGKANSWLTKETKKLKSAHQSSSKHQ